MELPGCQSLQLLIPQALCDQRVCFIFRGLLRLVTTWASFLKCAYTQNGSEVCVHILQDRSSDF